MHDEKKGFILPIHHDNGSGYDERKNPRHNRYFHVILLYCTFLSDFFSNTPKQHSGKDSSQQRSSYHIQPAAVQTQSPECAPQQYREDQRPAKRSNALIASLQKTIAEY